MRARRLVLLLAMIGCAVRAPQARLDIEAIGANRLWIPTVRNSTDAALRLPATNPLRSLAEMAGKISLDEGATVMALLRDSLRREVQQRNVRALFTEEHDGRLAVLPLGHEAAARIAREGGLDGSLLLSEIRRWDADAAGLMRLWLEFKLVRIADGALLAERRVQKVFPAGRSGNPAEVHNDALREIVKELF